MKSLTLKKIIPTLLITIILFTGFFGVFGVGVVSAQEENIKQLTDQELRDFIKVNYPFYIKTAEDPATPRVRLETIMRQNLTATAQLEAKKVLNNPNSTAEEKKEAEKKRDAKINEIESVYKNNRKAESCSPFNLTECIRGVLANVGEAVLEFFGFILGISGKLLNVVVKYTVLQMGTNVKNIGALEEGWKVFRDLSNIVIIFVLLYIGISTILRLEGFNTKKLLGMLITVALLINFSLFFTQVVIDSSNLLALQFYDKTEKIEEAKGGWGVTGWSGFGDSYMQAFRLSTLYDVGDFSDIVQKQLNSTNIFLITIFGSILFIVAAFTLLAGAFLLMSRYVVLIFLMILSPIAFIAYVLPATSGYAKQWMTILFKNAIFAPVYFLLTWFVIKVINSPAFANSIGLGATSKDGAVSFAKLTDVNSFEGSIALVLNFIIVIFFLMAALLLANQLGIKGSETVMKWGASARKWGLGVVGRTFVGTGSKYAGKAYDRASASKVGSVLKNIPGFKSLELAGRSILSAGEGAKFGSGASYADMEKRHEKRGKEIADKQMEIKQKEAIKNVIDPNSKAFEDLSEAEQEKQREYMATIGNMGIKELERSGIKGRLSDPNIATNISTEQLEAISKSEEFTKQEFKEIRDAKFDRIIKAAKSGDKKALRALSDKDIEMFGERLYEEDIIKGLSQTQIDGIKKSGKLNGHLKGHVIGVNTKYFNDLAAKGNGSLEAELRSMKIPQLAKLDPNIILNKEAIRAHSPAVLMEFAKELKVGDRAKLRDRINKLYKAALRKHGGDEKTALTKGDITKEQIASYEWLNKKDTPLGAIL
jgi:hypothetical protein